MEVPKYLRLKIYSFLRRKDWVLISSKLSKTERSLLLSSAILFSSSDDKKMTLILHDECDFTETHYLRRLFTDLTLDLTHLTNYNTFTNVIANLRETNDSLSISLNFNLEGLPIDQLAEFEIKHLRVETANTYSFQ
jgi:hypothetical protein